MNPTLGCVLALNAAVIAALMLGLWLASIRLGDPSFVDAFWGLGFAMVAAVTFGLTASVSGGTGPARRVSILAITSVWGVRLAVYLFRRWRRSGPDARYVALLRKAGKHPHLFTLGVVFGLQGALMWVVSLPVQLGQVYAERRSFAVWTIAGVIVAAAGIAIESAADAQLSRFKADPASAGKVMDRGLWRYTRHPNYFGDACVWWGLFLVSVTSAITLVAAIGPAVMTWLLAKWSGIPTLERRMKRSRPGYEDYIRRTSSFVPRPPKS